ncbi:MAG: GNAT family N-acetyltransferase [Acidobacteriota bacterium]|nr:GNAT family N-acetyltransferase [Acidobacteriota bacterium]
MAGSQAISDVTIEILSSEPQFREAVALQQTIWGFDEIELLPVRLFVVASKIGGHAFGAYREGKMIAFCLAIPGLKPGGRAYLHGHMLGVLPPFRDLGIGRRLKLRQRDDALERGIDLIEWTFDPLEMRNAYFNVERLGAIVKRYVHNQYGSTTSHLHGGLPTDRCIAEWWIRSERAIAAVQGLLLAKPPIVERIEVPANIRQQEPTEAFRSQAQIATHFDAAFARGLTVVGVERGRASGSYLLAELP